MNRRGALTVLAFLVAGGAIGSFVAAWLHNSPTPITAVASGEQGAGGGPVVDIKVSTVAAVMQGDHPNWVGYLPTTFFKVPPNATVRMTIDQQDTPTGLRNEYLGLVRGTIGNSMTVYTSDPSAGGVTGKTMQAIDPTLAAHTFSVPGLGVSVPLPGVDASNPKNTDNFVQFSFKVPASGIYHWQCFVPCGAGTLYGLGGPMQTLGYMDGQIEVGP
ncbi:MAG: hypothetical protein DLM65_13520 [Candidatus Aeolococcus gillhamiae]|uniref:Uncharacterized protein n=1 Tax=Candidatus Aeolococcus gillhamiae TaxID=3127015 RepID=A0A2W5YZ53_9BACT|nr:MAG: hypothetical protein DLM65_13520 [Candidatus Dormibacter sp. RRmetagenome_bin12]